MATLEERLAELERTPPADLAGDPIWRLPAYRISVLLSIVVREDLLILSRRRESPHVPLQLERAVDSIGVNIVEGYSRRSGRDRARCFELSLSEAREAREWYRRCARSLGSAESLERGLLLTRVIRILSVAVSRDRDGESERRMERARRKRELP